MSSNLVEIARLQAKREFYKKLEEKLGRLQRGEINLSDWMNEVFEKNREINKKYISVEEEVVKNQSEIDWQRLNEELFKPKKPSLNQLKLPFDKQKPTNKRYRLFTGASSDIRTEVNKFLEANKDINIISQSFSAGAPGSLNLSLFYEE